MCRDSLTLKETDLLFFFLSSCQAGKRNIKKNVQLILNGRKVCIRQAINFCVRPGVVMCWLLAVAVLLNSSS